MIFQIYARAVQALKNQPLRILGLSLFGCLLIGLGSSLFGLIVGVAMAIALLFNAALNQVYLRSYRGEQCTTQDMFVTFKDKALLKRVLGGMAWRELWVFIWGLIPIVGPIFAIMKTYSWRLTPYILMNEPDVKPMDAIKVSEERTRGYRGKMFWADVLIFLIFYVVMAIVLIFCRIPYIQYLFFVVALVVVVVFAAMVPLFLGLVQAAFYDEINNPSIPLTAPAAPQQGFQQPAYPQQPQQTWTNPAAPAAPVVPVAPVVPTAPASPFEPAAPAAPFEPIAPPAPEAPAVPAEPLFRFCTNCGTRFDRNQTNVCPNCGKVAE